MSEQVPSPKDWLNIGNDMRKVMGLTSVSSCNRYPTEEELRAYDRVLPGVYEQIIDMAHKEMSHRMLMELKSQSNRLSKWFYVVEGEKLMDIEYIDWSDHGLDKYEAGGKASKFGEVSFWEDDLDFAINLRRNNVKSKKDFTILIPESIARKMFEELKHYLKED